MNDLTDRTNHIHDTIITHCEEIGITATPVEDDDWDATPVEKARGWADLQPGGEQIGAEPPIEFLYCPDTIASTTANLVDSFGAGPPLLSLPGYLEILLDLIDSQVLVMEEAGGEMVALSDEQRDAAIDSTGEDLGWESMAALFAIQSAAIDAQVGVRNDLAGDPDWAGSDVDTGFGL